ncbi:MAG: Uma2 family endonuclease [Longimicrobiales bacterium]
MSRSTFSPLDWTYEDYARLPDDGNRYEILDGEILVRPRPGPDHQHVIGNLYLRLRPYVEDSDLGTVLCEVDFLFVPGQYVSPDLIYVPTARRHGITRRGVEALPDLVVEVLSPGSASVDQVRKRELYAGAGVPEYWVVDPFRRVVWRYDSARGGAEPERVEARLVWQPQEAGTQLELDVADLFRGI